MNNEDSSEKKCPKIVYQKKENVQPDYSRPMPSEPMPGWKIQDRIYISEKGSLFVGFNDEVNPAHTGHGYASYAFGVMGDILVGDVLFIERNPHQVGIRHTPLVRATPFNIYSNRHLSSDTYGGASINLYSDEPDSPEMGKVNSGYLNLVAYGRGTGEKANSIRFFTRNKPNSIAERMTVKGNGKVGVGTNKPEEKLDIYGNVKVGSKEKPKGIILYDEEDGKRYVVKVKGGKLVLE